MRKINKYIDRQCVKENLFISSTSTSTSTINRNFCTLVHLFIYLFGGRNNV